MIVGLGTDIVSTERIAGVLAKNQQQFVERICREEEKTYLQQTRDLKVRLAKIWAVKEAAAKALGTGFSQGVSFRDICLKHDVRGKPELEFFGRAEEIMKELTAGGKARLLVSLSDDRPFAQAVVIIEKI